ncbi:hypothetical protein [Nostoc sp. 'Peltigera malacea cyanobiont' DB3992]|uniref:hypothetical protein n=1 Tax=Nostoc sp. 'Peltigera malacea cyanobiont' DB3992 TaxID=1206980 RepID=UPI000C04DA07|nr:hypothetical protein [Nostoc sp. 'Peltigera malacea cyanobiont' DB3992]PHM09462.1 hypothetical protein CK516_14470 [Nostoc sp. 'Peltigera malacea cyanobiont' DB3992]
MNHRIEALVIEFLKQYPDIDSDENFSVMLEDGTVVDKIGNEIWVSTFTLNNTDENQQTDTENIRHD